MKRESIRELDNRLGLRFRNNPRGVISPLIAGLHLRGARTVSGHGRDRDIGESVDNGAHILGDLYDPGLAERIRSDIREQLMDDDTAFVKRLDGTEFVRGLNHNQIDFQEVDGIGEVMRNPEVSAAVRSYYGSDYSHFATSVLRYRHFPPERMEELPPVRSNPRRWHFDNNVRNNAVKLLVFLTENSSPIEIVSSRQSREILGEFSLEEIQANPELVPEYADVMEYGGDAGTAILFNPCTQFHRGTNPDPGEVRTILMLGFVPRLSRR